MQFPGYIECEPLFSAEEFKEFKLNCYPNGISKHGETYLHNPFKSSGPNMSFAPNVYIIETVFELVRQLKYPEKKSRFISTFACLNLEDAKKIKSETFNNEGKIYRVSCESYIKVDMSFLRQACSIIGIQILADKYWSGQSSGNPFWEILMENPIFIDEQIE